MKKLIKYLFFTIVGINVILNVTWSPIKVYAWGDSNGGRPSYTIEQINQGVLGDKIVFNSISDSPMGNEKNFVAARENTGINLARDNVWNANDINVENGKEYLIRLYVHNNNPKGMDAVAENTHVSFSLPQESARDLQIDGFINSSNANPQEYWDHVTLHSDTAFHLEYVYGSAIMENNGIGKSVENGGTGAYNLSDDIVKAASGGTLIGYDAIDGRIPGCYQYDAYISIRVKVVYDAGFTVDKKVRIKGNTDQAWKDQVEAKIGDEVEFRIEYVNASEQTQERVVMRDILPANLEYVPDTIKLFNANYPNGITTKATSLIEDAGTVIGSYTAGSNGVLYFDAKLVDESLTFGSNSIINWGGVTVGQTVMTDWAQIDVKKKEKIVIETKVMIIVAIFSAIVIICFIIIIKQHQKIRHIEKISSVYEDE